MDVRNFAKVAANSMPKAGMSRAPAAAVHSPFLLRMKPLPLQSLKRTHRPRLRWPVASLRTYLLLVIVVATVPLGALTSWLMAQEILASRRQLSQGLIQTAGSLALMVEREQVSSIDALTILSHTTSLKEGDLAGFHARLVRLPLIRPSWSRVVLTDPEGHTLLRSTDPVDPVLMGAAVPARPLPGGMLPPPRIQGLRGASGNDLFTRIAVPVEVQGRLAYWLAADIHASAWQSLIGQGHSPHAGYVTVFDEGYRIIARSLHPERFVGQMLPQDGRARMGSKASGFQKTSLLEGGDTYVAWQRIALSQWGIGVGVAATPLDRGNLWAISMAVLAALISLLAGVGLSLFVVRRVNEPLHALATGGASAVPGEIAVHEIAQLRDAMRSAEAQREQARERLEAKAAEFETLFNTSPIGLSITQDPDCRVVLRNPAKVAMFGFREGQVASYEMLQNGRPLQPHEHPLQRAARGETVWNQEVEVRHPDGKVLRLLAHAVPLLDGHGHPRGAIATYVDITERMLAQERLMRARTRLQDSQHLVELAQEAGDVGFFDRVLATDTVTMTSGLARLFGLDRRAVETSWVGWLARVHPDDAPVIEATLAQAWAEQAQQVVFKFRTAGQAEERWLSSRTVMLYSTEGTPLRLIGVMVDVTAQQQVEQERARLISQEHQARLEAERANRAKDEFLAMLGHELRNPLSAISAAIEVLNRISSQDEQAVKVRTIITRQTRHLARLMDDLMDVARVIAGKIHLSRQPLNLGAMVGRLVHTMQVSGLLQAHPLSVHTEDVWVNGDAMRLEQIVNNLVTNAVKYSPPERPITVRVHRDGTKVKLEVIDQGFGIPAHLLPHIFDLFVQGERTLDRRQGGLGIGLTLVRRLAELHDGEVAVRSGTEGSVFTVTMPALDGEPVEPTADSVPATTAREVVLVEDNADAREALTTMLTLQGHHVQAAAEGRSGLALLLARRPHLALVDIGLPGLTGYEVARQARAAGHTGWMIAVSGYGQQQDVQLALEAGFDAHMVKPIDGAALERWLARAPRGPGAAA